MDGLGGPVRRFIGLAMIILPCLSLSFSLSPDTHTHTICKKTAREIEKKSWIDGERERLIKEGKIKGGRLEKKGKESRWGIINE